MFKKAISLILSVSLILTQPVFAQGAADLNIGKYLNQMPVVKTDSFRPAHLRYVSYDIKSNDFKLLLDQGDVKLPNSPSSSTPKLQAATQELFNYFLIGLSLPNDKFWVNLRPDAPEQIIDPLLEKTDVGKIMLEADLELKKDTAGLTSPQNPEGKEYWDKLYKKAGELFGTENITIPTITRPWIVPGEVIIRESEDSAYIYKANLKVMLEEDYLTGRGGSRTAPTYQQYTFSDPRMKELNKYSTELIKELILPKLTQEINTSKKYAQLRQVFFSLILSRWFKDKYKGNPGQYSSLIDSRNLDNLNSKESWDREYYFSEYKKSFQQGEYNLKEQVATPTGQVIRSYVSGGISPLEGISFISQQPNSTIGTYLSDNRGFLDLSPLLKMAVYIGNKFGFLKKEKNNILDRLNHKEEIKKLLNDVRAILLDYNIELKDDEVKDGPKDGDECGWLEYAGTMIERWRRKSYRISNEGRFADIWDKLDTIAVEISEFSIKRLERFIEYNKNEVKKTGKDGNVSQSIKKWKGELKNGQLARAVYTVIEIFMKTELWPESLKTPGWKEIELELVNLKEYYIRHRRFYETYGGHIGWSGGNSRSSKDDGSSKGDANNPFIGPSGYGTGGPYDLSGGSSPLAPQTIQAQDAKLKTGGIDFTRINYLTRPMGSFQGLDLRLPLLSKADLEGIDINKELASVEQMINARIDVSTDRLKRLLAAMSQKDAFSAQRETQLLPLLLRLCWLKEEKGSETTPDFRAVLLIADTGLFVEQGNTKYSLN